jgi:hypothetical protein
MSLLLFFSGHGAGGGGTGSTKTDSTFRKFVLKEDREILDFIISWIIGDI